MVEDIAAPIKNALVGGPFGSNLVSRDYVSLGVPVIRGQNMSSRWVEGDFAFVSEKKAAQLSPNTARPGDLIFTQRGTLGQVAIVPQQPFDHYIVSQSQMKLTVDSQQTDALFLYYFFSSEEQQDYVRRNAVQTGVPHTNLEHLRRTPLLLPPLPEQRAIAAILGALDDKIELNRTMNQRLEQMAQALFKSWFVDFDPVHANRNGEAMPGLAREVQALFPSAFEDSALGEIPQGWQIEPLDRIAHFLNGLALQKFPAIDDYLPVIKIAELRKGVTESSGKASPNIEAKYIVDDGDILFSWSGSLEVVVWCGGRGALNQHLFKVTSAQYPRWFYYLWTKEHLPEFQSIAAGKATTMGHIQRHHLTAATTRVPPPHVLKSMTNIIEPLLMHIVNNNIASRTLAATRDALLPKLLSGEVRVREVEKMIEEIM
ncbi:MAG: restriction endonuclease subunit S [Chloroflexi bacterium]|nr:restriction endonuclease subunit S [Chloroflexota bacterium]